MNAAEYQRRWATTLNRNEGQRIIVPEDVMRLDDHEPCFFCGTRAGLPCKHRRWAA